MPRKFKFIKILTLISAVTFSCYNFVYNGNCFNSVYAVEFQKMAFKNEIKTSPVFASLFNDEQNNGIAVNTKENIIYKKNLDSLFKNNNDVKDRFKTISVDCAEKEFDLLPLNNVDVEDVIVNYVNYLKVKNFEERIDHNNRPKIRTGTYNGIKYDRLKKDDLIVSVNNKKVCKLNAYELVDLVNELKMNQNLNIDFLRFDQNNGRYECLKYESTVNTDFLNRNPLNFKILKKSSGLSSSKDEVVYIKIKDINYSNFNLLVNYLKKINAYFTKSLIIDLTECSCSYNYGAAKRMAGLFLPKNMKYITVKNLIDDANSFVLENHESPIIKADGINTDDDDDMDDKIKLRIIANNQINGAALQLAAILNGCANAKIYTINGTIVNHPQIENKIFALYDDAKNEKINYLSFGKTAYKIGNASCCGDDFKMINNALDSVKATLLKDTLQKNVLKIATHIVCDEPKKTLGKCDFDTYSLKNHNLFYNTGAVCCMKNSAVCSNILMYNNKAERNIEPFWDNSDNDPALNIFMLLLYAINSSIRSGELKNLPSEYPMNHTCLGSLTTFIGGESDKKFDYQFNFACKLFSSFLKNEYGCLGEQSFDKKSPITTLKNEVENLKEQSNKCYYNETKFFEHAASNLDELPFTLSLVHKIFSEFVERNKNDTYYSFNSSPFLIEAIKEYSANEAFYVNSFSKFLEEKHVNSDIFDINTPLPIYYYVLILQNKIKKLEARNIEYENQIITNNSFMFENSKNDDENQIITNKSFVFENSKNDDENNNDISSASGWDL